GILALPAHRVETAHEPGLDRQDERGALGSRYPLALAQDLFEVVHVTATGGDLEPQPPAEWVEMRMHLAQYGGIRPCARRRLGEASLRVEDLGLDLVVAGANLRIGAVAEAGDLVERGARRREVPAR